MPGERPGRGRRGFGCRGRFGGGTSTAPAAAGCARYREDPRSARRPSRQLRTTRRCTSPISTIALISSGAGRSRPLQQKRVPGRGAPAAPRTSDPTNSDPRPAAARPGSCARPLASFSRTLGWRPTRGCRCASSSRNRCLPLAAGTTRHGRTSCTRGSGRPGPGRCRRARHLARRGAARGVGGPCRATVHRRVSIELDGRR